MQLKNDPAQQSRAPIQINKRNAYHQAGQAVSIYRRNKLEDLPDLYFQIAVRPLEQELNLNGRLARIPCKYQARLEGGRLIPYLPYSFAAATKHFSPAEREQYQAAFEADICNLLVGSLAEAKYVAFYNNTVFNPNLVYLGALKFYGNGEDLKIINEYITCLFPCSKTEQNRKLTELFLVAYGFITDDTNWGSIEQVAKAIHHQPKEIFSYEELANLIENINFIEKYPPQQLNNAKTWQSID